MIYPLAGLVIGAILGAILAKRQKGNAADMAQWAAVGALVLGVIGLFILIFIERAHYEPTEADDASVDAAIEPGPETTQ